MEAEVSTLGLLGVPLSSHPQKIGLQSHLNHIPINLIDHTVSHQLKDIRVYRSTQDTKQVLSHPPRPLQRPPH